MRKFIKAMAILLAVVLACGMASLSAAAKDLEPCYHCDSTGKFYCNSCHNHGTLDCDLCGGQGKQKCQDCNGTGYVTCPSCNGDGKARPIPAAGDPGPCGNCGGSGKLRCIHCHTEPGWIICNRCNGVGKTECQASNCKAAQAVGWKCPYCRGAGYLLTNFWPGENDGVQNVPKKGDLIWVNGKSTTYGESGGGQSTTQPTVVNNAPPTTAPTAAAEEPAPPSATVSAPADRTVDFDITTEPVDGSTVRVSARVEVGKMSDEEARYYASLSEQELSGILTNVQQIVGSVSPGKMDTGVEELLCALAKQNGFDSVENGKLFPICFDGHQNVGFPVKVTVHMERGALAGGSDLFVYHIMQDGAVEPLGKAEYGTYDDGSVETLTFYTTGFSSFFTAAKELDLHVDLGDDVGDVTTIGATGGRSPWKIVAIVGVVAVVGAAAVTAVVLILKKRKAATIDEHS